jgi:hypothetical protein
MKRVLAAMTAALLMVTLASGAALAVKPGQQFTTTLTVGASVATETAAVGSYNGGFFVPTNGDGGFVYLGITNTTAKPDLAPGIYPFYLRAGTTQKAALTAYFAAKGWTDPTWYTQINAEIAGTAPFFYLTFDGSAYSIFDGFTYALGGGVAPLRVDNNYPTGTYLYTATLNRLNAQVKMKVYRALTLPTIDTSVCESITFGVLQHADAGWWAVIPGWFTTFGPLNDGTDANTKQFGPGTWTVQYYLGDPAAGGVAVGAPYDFTVTACTP